MSDFTEGLRATAAAALFPTEGELVLDGLEHQVTIGRDAWGVPYVEAASLGDLWFAQGFITAGERLFQLDMLLRAAAGRLSEVFGDRTIAEDRFARTIGFHRAGAILASGWDAESHHMHDRFREGVFSWVGTMPAPPVEYTLLDTEPELPRDEASWAGAFAYLAWGLSGNWDTELLRAWIRERAGDEAVRLLLPSPQSDPPEVHAGAVHGAVFDAIPRAPGQGSNDWVVAGSRTATGAPLLANDPHLLALQPGAWIELHLSAPGYRARGVALSFSPGVLLGTTAHHAWGVTNVSGDVQDLFVERLDEGRNAAGSDGVWEPLTVRREEIMVRGESGPHVLEVRETRHGPLLDTSVSGMLNPEYIALAPEPAYALRWTGRNHGIRPSVTVAAARASTFEEFRAATTGVECPGQNFVYADVDGTIGYTCSGKFPVRRAGNGTAPVPGHTSDHEWGGFVPIDELPWSVDPERGFLATANNRVHDETYPHLIGHDFHTPYRARRIVDVLSARDDHDVGSMVELQNDTVSLPARETLPLLLAAIGAANGRPERQLALTTLRGWNGDMGAGSTPAAIFNVWCRHIARRALVPLLGEELFRHYHAWREPFQCRALPTMLHAGELAPDLLETALDDALADLEERTGSADPSSWRWGALHRLRLAHPLATIPGLEALFVAVDVELGGDEQTVMQGGFDGRDGYAATVIPSWRAVFDLGDLDRSVGVLPAGISGNPASPHWNDQASLWQRGETHPLPFTEEAVEVAVVATLTLVPGGSRSEAARRMRPDQ